MLITIGDTYLFETKTWSEWASSTWRDLSALTWKDILVGEENYVLNTTAINIHHRVEDVSTADFQVYDETNQWHFQKGQPVVIRNLDYETEFSGFISSAKEKHIAGSTQIVHTIECIDNHYLAQKRTVAKAFQDETVETCVHWILDNVLSEEGVTEGEIQTTGVTISQKVFDYVSASDAMDTLSEYAGFTWFIDVDKKLYFIDRTTYTAPFDISVVSGEVLYVEEDSLEVTDGNDEFRDIQYIKGGQAETDTQTEYFKGDGVQTSWACGYKLGREPTIYVSLNGGEYVEADVGIKGVETSKDFYWSKNDPIITQDPTETKLTSVDTIKIEYVGLYAIVVKSANYAAIADRLAIEEVGTGKVECVAEDSLATTRDSALEKANSILDHFSVVGKKVTYRTTESGLSAGQLQHITIPMHDLDDDFLITDIDITEFGYVSYYDITAIKGPVDDYWTKVFLKLKAAGKTSAESAGEVDVLIVLNEFTHTWQDVDSPNIFEYVYPGDSTFPGTAELPCFEDGDEIKYIELCIDGDWTYRKYRTAQTIEDDQITTTVIIPSEEGNGTISAIRMYGGDLATETIGTGVLLTEHSFSKIKNSLESLQLTFFDIKGW
ncbi:MAG: hypothetical protein ACE14V_01325 [bacterium]